MSSPRIMTLEQASDQLISAESRNQDREARRPPSWRFYLSLGCIGGISVTSAVLSGALMAASMLGLGDGSKARSCVVFGATSLAVWGSVAALTWLALTD